MYKNHSGILSCAVSRSPCEEAFMCAFSQVRVAPFALITVSTADPPGLFKQINQQKKEENAN